MTTQTFLEKVRYGTLYEDIYFKDIIQPIIKFETWVVKHGEGIPYFTALLTLLNPYTLQPIYATHFERQEGDKDAAIKHAKRWITENIDYNSNRDWIIIDYGEKSKDEIWDIEASNLAKANELSGNSRFSAMERLHIELHYTERDIEDET